MKLGMITKVLPVAIMALGISAIPLQSEAANAGIKNNVTLSGKTKNVTTRKPFRVRNRSSRSGFRSSTGRRPAPPKTVVGHPAQPSLANVVKKNNNRYSRLRYGVNSRKINQNGGSRSNNRKVKRNLRGGSRFRGGRKINMNGNRN